VINGACIPYKTLCCPHRYLNIYGIERRKSPASLQVSHLFLRRHPAHNSAAASSDNASPLVYLLTPNQMLDNDYRLPSYLAPSDTRCIPGLDRSKLQAELAEILDYRQGESELGAQPESYDMAGKKSLAGADGDANSDDDEWVETPEATAPPPGGLHGLYPVMAIDCEMVGLFVDVTHQAYVQIVTQVGQELARVSVIDFQSGVNVYDKLVKPAHPVLDYRTQ
jgi:RNA exonuclease 1